MEKKEITVISPTTVGGTTIITVSNVKINGWLSKRGFFISGYGQLNNVIIATPSFRKAFRITGEEVPLDQLIQEHPDIQSMLEVI